MWIVVAGVVIAVGCLAFAAWWVRRPAVQRDLDELHAAVEAFHAEIGKAFLPAMRKINEAVARLSR